MKHEWKKHEKELYGAKAIPAVVEVSKQNYIMISGKGNPNNKEFSEKVSALYSLAYTIKMEYKSIMYDSISSDTITDYTVYPLEGIWEEKESIVLIKDDLVYTIMIRQPNFITNDIVDKAMEKVKKKKPNPFYEKVSFDTMQDGTCLEILHIGSYDEEPTSFKKMDEFAKQNGFRRCKTWHREIYLNNSTRVSKDKRKTILRYVIEEK